MILRKSIYLKMQRELQILRGEKAELEKRLEALKEEKAWEKKVL